MVKRKVTTYPLLQRCMRCPLKQEVNMYSIMRLYCVGVYALLKLSPGEIRAPNVLYLAKEIFNGRGCDNPQIKHYYCRLTFVK